MTTTAKKLPGWVKPALEIGPILLFFLVFSRIKGEVFTVLGRDYSGFIVTTAAFVALTLAATLALWALTGKLSKMQVVTMVIVLVMGGLSVWLNDERFIKMKPTLIYAVFGLVLAIGLMRGEGWLSHVLGEGLDLTPEGWRALTGRFVLFFLALALANEAVWRNASTDTWVSFKTFALTLAPAVFILSQYGLVVRHTVPPAEDPEETPSTKG